MSYAIPIDLTLYTIYVQLEALLVTNSFNLSKKNQWHKKQWHFSPSPDQTNRTSSLPEKQIDSREQNAMGHN